jgi:hypothetical protein
MLYVMTLESLKIKALVAILLLVFIHQIFSWYSKQSGHFPQQNYYTNKPAVCQLAVHVNISVLLSDKQKANDTYSRLPPDKSKQFQ